MASEDKIQIARRLMKEFAYADEVPAEVLENYDHLDEEEKDYGWVNWYGQWAHISDFMRLSGNHPLSRDWDGYSSDSYYSGLVIKFMADGDRYMIALYTS